jgi:sulfoxide reductase catalytic subunit YedY
MPASDQYKSVPVKPSEITPEHLFYSRRDFLKSLGIVGAGAALAACGGLPAGAAQPTNLPTSPAQATTAAQVDELNDPVNSYEDITTYNNFYEFSTDKGEVARRSTEFRTSPWNVEVYGLVNKPQTFGLEDLLGKFTQEERIYRLRCVEGWSMVIPWMGFSLAGLLKEVEPLSSAKYVRFETLFDPEQMPKQKSRLFPWPYQEGLRLDEALHDLTILATGLYGNPMPPQNGAPVRLVVPWKYGFKSIKSIVKIELVADEPDTMWSDIAPDEYGFYANVNPDVPHPRWSQASERRIGELSRRPTLLYNGYADQVAGMYQGMGDSIFR